MQLYKSFFKFFKFFRIIPRRNLGNIFLWFKAGFITAVIIPILLQFPLISAGQVRHNICYSIFDVSKVCPEQIDFFSVTVEESDLVSKGGFVVLDIESKVIFPVTFDSKFMGEFGTNPDANQGNDQTEYNTEKPHPTFRDFIGKVWNYLYKEVHSSPIKSGLYWFIILVIPAWIVAFIMPDSYFTKVSKNVPFVHRD